MIRDIIVEPIRYRNYVSRTSWFWFIRFSPSDRKDTSESL